MLGKAKGRCKCKIRKGEMNRNVTIWSIQNGKSFAYCKKCHKWYQTSMAKFLDNAEINN